MGRAPCVGRGHRYNKLVAFGLQRQRRSAEHRCVAQTHAHIGSPTVVGIGGVGIDYLASVAKFPAPDEKMRSETLDIQGGGNCGNALTGLARLGVSAKVLSTIGTDPLGDKLMQEFERDGVSTQFLQRVSDAPTPFTYIIVDTQGVLSHVATARMCQLSPLLSPALRIPAQVRSFIHAPHAAHAHGHVMAIKLSKRLLSTHLRAGGTRTCIHTPGAALCPADMTPELTRGLLAGADLVYFDGRLTEAALVAAMVAEKAGIPVLVEAERLRPGLELLMAEADYVVTSGHYPQDWTGEDSVGDGILATALRVPKVKWMVCRAPRHLPPAACAPSGKGLAVDPSSHALLVRVSREGAVQCALLPCVWCALAARVRAAHHIWQEGGHSNRLPRGRVQ
jgi:sugar/nucleoside kinase (ribokinase family)